VHPRENPGYAYEKMALPYIGMGPRMAIPALTLNHGSFVSWVI